MDKKYVNVIDWDICNRKIEFKAESAIMKKKNKKNRNYKEVDMKIWRALKCKEILVAPCVSIDYGYTPWFSLQILICTVRVYKVCFCRLLELELFFFNQSEPTFL